MSAQESRLEKVIAEVKKEFTCMLVKRERLVKRLGQALEQVRTDKTSICAEIKEILRDEIINKQISERDIERYCEEDWKQKTKPKKNDKMSISEETDKMSAIVSQGNQVVTTSFEADPAEEAKKEVEDERKTTFLKDEYELDRLRAQVKTLTQELVAKQDNNPLLSELKQERNQLTEQVRQKDAELAKWQSSDAAKLTEKLDALQKQVNMLERVTSPFKAGTRVEVNGHMLVLLVEVDPRTKRIRAEVDEPATRRAN